MFIACWRVRMRINWRAAWAERYSLAWRHSEYQHGVKSKNAASSIWRSELDGRINVDRNSGNGRILLYRIVGRVGRWHQNSVLYVELSSLV